MATQPQAAGDTISFSAFTAEDPTLATTDEASTALLAEGQLVTLTATAGDPTAMAAIDGQTVAATVMDTTTVALDLDLSAVDVTGLTADALISDPVPPDPPEPPPPGTSNHVMASMSPGIGTYWHPTPGVGGMRVEVNPDQPAPPIPPEWQAPVAAAEAEQTQPDGV